MKVLEGSEVDQCCHHNCKQTDEQMNDLEFPCIGDVSFAPNFTSMIPVKCLTE
jgi:hypothetical protein